MIYLFAAIKRADRSNHIQKIRLSAETETAARAVLARDYILFPMGRINPKNLSQTNRTLGGNYA